MIVFFTKAIPIRWYPNQTETIVSTKKYMIGICRDLISEYVIKERNDRDTNKIQIINL
jgi:hypothetical protein